MMLEMLPRSLVLLCLAVISTRAQETVTIGSSTTVLSTLTTNLAASDFSGSYISYTAQSTQDTSTLSSSNASETSGSSSHITQSTTSKSQLIIGGSATPTSTSSGNATASSTSSSVLSNTVACNNYPEFCDRLYSNITEVCAHNSAFAVANNAASNQALPIRDQLDDGIRMLQGETHWVNNTIMNCHTSCDLLNAGTWQSELETLVGWLQDNPYNVVTFLIVNSDYTTVENYVPAIQNSGIEEYLYIPTYVPQYKDQWPTLSEMILDNKRVVMFMDYNANQTAVPYVLDEFSHMWETPFSPTDQSFPCTQQRPPGLNQTVARDQYMYLANHDLNVAVDLGALTGGGSSESILIPNVAELNITNGEQDQFGRLGAATLNCTSEWGTPPRFLLVDYYNMGSPSAGSVFEVAAQANGVTYTRACCGTAKSASSRLHASSVALAATFMFCVILAW